jgi:hypothetical protein
MYAVELDLREIAAAEPGQAREDETRVPAASEIGGVAPLVAQDSRCHRHTVHYRKQLALHMRW